MPNREVHLKRWQLVLGLLLLTASFVLAVLLVQREAKTRSDANRELIEQQQAQRAEITYTTCLDQNERHDKTIQRLDEILSKAGQNDPVNMDALRRTRASTIFIIEALAPHQNCKQIVIDRFGYVPEVSVNKEGK